MSLKIIITGPESSGKTTLCKQLSKYFNIPFSDEYARKYLEKLNKTYTQEDLLNIAKGQVKLEQLATHKQQISLHDTDLITIKIWSEYKYDNCDKWITQQIEQLKTEQRFYLLCKPDIPWKADPQRENPNNRAELFNIYTKELTTLGQQYSIIKGEERLKDSILKISQLIDSI